MQERKYLDPAQQPFATGDMDPEAFRIYSHQVVDWIADYLTHVGEYPVLAQTIPGDIRYVLPDKPPVQPESMETILADFERIVLPGITHWNSPGFMAYFAITGSGPGILGEMLSGALNVNAMLWRTSPAATELEQVTLDWLRQMHGLPHPLFGVINDTASSGTLYALAAARETLPLHIRHQGMAGREDVPRLRYYASHEAHSSVEKAGIVLGVGQSGLRKIGVDGEFRMDVGQLEQAIQEDFAAGWRPFAVVATVGTTSTTSVDPVPQIADICERYGLWLHVDGAYGGSAAVDPEMRWVLDSCERADSLIVNPHKWLFTPMDCSVFYTRKPDIVKAAFSLVPEYLRSAESAGEDAPVNLMDYGTSLGRRFRSLKLWMIMRYFGQEGLAARIHEHIRLGQLVRQWVEESSDFEIMAPTPFSTVCFRAHPKGMDDETQLELLNEHIMNRINTTGRFFLSHTKLHDQYTIRIAIGNLRTTEEDVRALWGEIQTALADEQAS